jgi:hypothetical protein
MRRILVCSGVLGGGTALVFALAAATALLFPQGTLVPANSSMMFAKPGMGLMIDDVVAVPGTEPAVNVVPFAAPDAVPVP